MDGNRTRRRVLFVVYNAAHFRELFRLAQTLFHSGRYLPLVLFVSPYPGWEKHYKQCRHHGFPSWTRGQPIEKNKPKWLLTFGLVPSLAYSALKFVAFSAMPAPLLNVMARLHCRLLRITKAVLDKIKVCVVTCKSTILNTLRNRDSLITHFLRTYKERSYAHRMCRILKPTILILAEDNVEYLSGAWIYAAHKRGTPCLIVPYCLAGIEEPAAVYYHHPNHNAASAENAQFSKKYPHWVFEYQGRHLLRLPARRALPIEWLKISSPLPWVMNGSYADAIAVESPFMQDFYKRQGIPTQQLLVTGSASDDIIYHTQAALENNRRELYRRFGMQLDKPMLLCALPPATSAMDSIRNEFASYEDMLQFWLQCLADVGGYNIFISLHPTMDRSRFERINESGLWGFAIAPSDTARMIALCDIYVASVSSTIRWAIACGKPVINYDVYRFRFPDFRPARGVITVETKEDFIAALKRITTDPTYYESLKQAQSQSCSYWGKIDGSSNRRLIGLIDELIRRYQKANFYPQRNYARKLLDIWGRRELTDNKAAK